MTCLTCGTGLPLGDCHRRRRYCSRPCYTASRRNTPERFWSKVDKKTDGCWEWRGTIDDKGYGVVGWHGEQILAHRMSLILSGCEPGSLFVCHRCDNPPCVRPDHLFLGTAKDNLRDMVTKGRALVGDRNPSRRFPERRPRGEAVHNAKLTEDDVRRIRRLSAAGTLDRGVIARELGVTWGCIDLVRKGRSWKAVTEITTDITEVPAQSHFNPFPRS